MASLNRNRFYFYIALVVAVLTVVNGFSRSTSGLSGLFQHSVQEREPCRRVKAFSLYMGRHAVVRALTKARTDGAKSKNNSR